MNRSQLLAGTGGVILAGIGLGAAEKPLPNLGKTLTKPSSGNIKVAIMISPMATVIDFAGPWETFQDAGYDTYVVSKSLDIVEATNGLKIKPDFTFADAPRPNGV